MLNTLPAESDCARYFSVCQPLKPQLQNLFILNAWLGSTLHTYTLLLPLDIVKCYFLEASHWQTSRHEKRGYLLRKMHGSGFGRTLPRRRVCSRTQLFLTFSRAASSSGVNKSEVSEAYAGDWLAWVSSLTSVAIFQKAESARPSAAGRSDLKTS